MFLDIESYADGDDVDDQAEASTGVTRDYYCSECRETLQLSSIGILKHKRMHAQHARLSNQ